jgi:hypothetical protein
MAYFQDFLSPPDVATYSTVVPSTLGISLPFWFAVVGIRQGSPIANVSASPSFGAIAASTAGQVIADVVVGTANGIPSLAVIGDDFVSAVIVVARSSGLTYIINVRLDDQTSVFDPAVGLFPPVTGPLILNPRTLPGAIHGFAGGSSEPTNAEIKAWFTTLKVTLKIPPIPGKTTHLYSADSVFPAVPGFLPNLGSAGPAQDMTLVVVGAPTPANVLIPTRFPW